MDASEANFKCKENFVTEMAKATNYHAIERLKCLKALSAICTDASDIDFDVEIEELHKFQYWEETNTSQLPIDGECDDTSSGQTEAT